MGGRRPGDAVAARVKRGPRAHVEDGRWPLRRGSTQGVLRGSVAILTLRLRAALQLRKGAAKGLRELHRTCVGVRCGGMHRAGGPHRATQTELPQPRHRLVPLRDQGLVGAKQLLSGRHLVAVACERSTPGFIDAGTSSSRGVGSRSLCSPGPPRAGGGAAAGRVSPRQHRRRCAHVPPFAHLLARLIELALQKLDPRRELLQRRLVLQEARAKHAPTSRACGVAGPFWCPRNDPRRPRSRWRRARAPHPGLPLALGRRGAPR
mmetsp:Transcript_67105/g.187321  ORF Transcript_67105/g.187321 Transcript_67105/m.187321 type:complete len:263 (-) Transcript_67105:107-895(-)